MSKILDKVIAFLNWNELDDEDVSTVVNQLHKKTWKLRRNQDLLVALLRNANDMTLNEVRDRVQEMGGFGEEI